MFEIYNSIDELVEVFDGYGSVNPIYIQNKLKEIQNLDIEVKEIYNIINELVDIFNDNGIPNLEYVYNTLKVIQDKISNPIDKYDSFIYEPYYKFIVDMFKSNDIDVVTYNYNKLKEYFKYNFFEIDEIPFDNGEFIMYKYSIYSTITKRNLKEFNNQSKTSIMKYVVDFILNDLTAYK